MKYNLLKPLTRYSRSRTGVTLIEVVVAASLGAVVILSMFKLFTPMVTYFQKSQVRQQLTRESRYALDAIKRAVGNARGDTMTISTPNGSPTYPANSMLSFSTVDNVSYSISWSPPSTLTMTRSANGQSTETHLSDHVSSIMFSGDTRDSGVLNILLIMQGQYGSRAELYEVVLPVQTIRLPGP